MDGNHGLDRFVPANINGGLLGPPVSLLQPMITKPWEAKGSRKIPAYLISPLIPYP
jgi:hypothetical protein